MLTAPPKENQLCVERREPSQQAIADTRQERGLQARCSMRARWVLPNDGKGRSAGTTLIGQLIQLFHSVLNRVPL